MWDTDSDHKSGIWPRTYDLNKGAYNNGAQLPACFWLALPSRIQGL